MMLFGGIKENVTVEEKEVDVEEFNDLFRNEMNTEVETAE